VQADPVLPIWRDDPAEPVQADPGPPIQQDNPAEPELAGQDASASKEPQASDEDDEDASDWFRPARKRAPVEQDDADIEAAASWEAPSYWFRPAIKPAGDPGDAPASPGGEPEVADEPDLFAPRTDHAAAPGREPGPRLPSDT
jgi:hypothetical protein